MEDTAEKILKDLITVLNEIPLFINDRAANVEKHNERLRKLKKRANKIL